MKTKINESFKDIEKTTIEKKALVLARIDGWKRSDRIGLSTDIWQSDDNDFKYELNLIDIYSSYDKLMEFYYNIDHPFTISIDSYLAAAHLYKYDDSIYHSDYKNKLNKEALLNCLLKYFQEIYLLNE